MRISFSLLVFAVLCYSSTLFAEDVLRFRGDNSQGKFNEMGLLESWPAEGLKPKWVNSELGEGWSSVIKVRDRLYLAGIDAKDEKKESIICLDLNGRQLWQQPVGGLWTAAYSFPRATPTYVVGENGDDDKLLMLSGTGELYCIAASDGKYLWRQEIAKTYQTRFGLWGMSESVVAHDGKVFVTACGKKALAVAFHIADGSLAWESEPIDDLLAYIAPVLWENYLIFLTDRYVTLLHAETGQLFWKGDYWEASDGKSWQSPAFCNSAIVKGNRFLVAQGYNQGAVMYEILPDGKGIEKIWTSKILDPHHDGMVEHDGRIYGSNWTNNNAGNWCCLDWETGETVYEEAWGNLGKGVTIFADGKLYLYEEKRGTLALANPGDKFEIISSFQIDFGTREHWPHPVISDGVLYVRRGNSLAAFDIKK